MPIVNQQNFNATSLIAPDLYVVIVPPSQLAINGVPSNIVGLVGLASWGPVNTPVQIGSMAQYAQTFGPLANRTYDMGTHAAIATQQGANSFYCVRVTDGSEAKASVAIGSTNITLTAKYPGILGNSVAITVGNGSKANSYRFTVGVGGSVPETFDNIQSVPTTATQTVNGAVSSSTSIVMDDVSGIVSGMVISGTGVSGSPTVVSVNSGTKTVTASAAQTIADNAVLTFTAANNSVWVALAAAINNGQYGRLPSQWLTAVAGSGTTAPSVGTTYTLSGGTDGATVAASDLIGQNVVPPTGMYALPPAVTIIDVCDMTDPTQFTTVDQFANSISAYAIQQIASGNTVAQAVTIKQTAGLDSYNSKLMHGDFLYWNDPVNQITRLVAPQAFVAGRFGNLTPQLTAVNKQIYSVAGSQRTGMIGAAQVVSPYTQAEINTLTLNGIDAVMNPGAGGVTIWTCRHGHNSSSNPTIHLDNYPTLTNYIAKTLAAGMGYYIGQPITKSLFGNISATLSFFLSQLTGAGMLSSPDGSTPWNVVCSIANNPPQNTNLGIVTADVQAKYPSINEKFVVNLQGGNTVTVSNTSISSSH